MAEKIYYFDNYDSTVAPSTVTYYFTERGPTDAWATDPNKMVDGDTGTFAATGFDNDYEKCITNSCVGTNLGTITKVEIRANHKVTGILASTIDIKPIFNGSDDGDTEQINPFFVAAWSDYFDITEDTNAPGTWTWADVQNLDCGLTAQIASGTVFVSKVEVRVTYGGSTGEEWATDPAYMVDGNESNGASTIENDIQLCNGNTCPATNYGTISKVEIRAYGNSSSGNATYFRPVFGGTDDGDNHNSGLADSGEWSSWFDITTDTNAPGTWDWDDVKNLDLDAEFVKSGIGGSTLYIIQIKVTYTEPASAEMEISGSGQITISGSGQLTIS